MKIKVYSQLSLNVQTIKSILPLAEVSGPVQRGQVLKDIDEGVNIIAIIDGQFEQNLAVAPSEIMDAMRAGLKIYGSSSMGALRAVECEKYGAIGYGKIFEYIKKSESFRDDYLGQLFLGQNQDWQSKTYIDFYFSAENLLEEKRISKKIAKKLCEIYGNLFYAERNESSLIAAIHRQKSSVHSLTDAAKLIFSEKKSQKTIDAEGLLALIKDDLESIQRINSVILSSAAEAPDPLSFYPRDLYD